ncbi:MAG: energy transducer TonB [Balneola sp.]
MSIFDPDSFYEQTKYQHRVMVCIIISQLVLICIFRFWPALEGENKSLVFNEPTQEIFIEQSIATIQEDVPARPPRPQIPVPVPNDEIIEEEIELPDFEDILPLEKLGEEEFGQTGDSNEPVASPQKSPTPLRIVEPATPDEAKKANIIAEVYVTFLVGKNGMVEEIYVSSIRMYESNGKDYSVVQDIGYGILNATLSAAEKWKFNPAQDNGEPVRAYTTQVFSFGF